MDEVESLESDVLNFTEGVSSKTGSAAALSNQRSVSMSRGAVTHKNSNRSQRKGARGYENDQLSSTNTDLKIVNYMTAKKDGGFGSNSKSKGQFTVETLGIQEEETVQVSGSLTNNTREADQ